MLFSSKVEIIQFDYQVKLNIYGQITVFSWQLKKKIIIIRNNSLTLKNQNKHNYMSKFNQR